MYTMVHYGANNVQYREKMANFSPKKTFPAARVAEAISGRREQLGLTLRALAARSGVSSSMISDIERGAKSPTISTLAALAEALGASISAFVDGAQATSSRLRVVRAAERPLLIDPASGARRDSFGPAVPGSRVEFLCYELPP